MEPEPISSVLSRTTNRINPHGLRVVTQSASDSAPASPSRTLHDLVRGFEIEEQRENPDLVTPLATLRMNPEGMVEVPRLGAFAFTDWSRRQCASLLGVRWDKWFANTAATERADEVNRRFARASGTVRLRTTRLVEPVSEVDHGVEGILRAFVSPGYSPVGDARLGRMLIAALAPDERELRLVRADLTDRTTSYVVGIGKPFRHGDDGMVGDVWGGLLVRNSGVGYASLIMTLHLTRLVCLNGMTAPLPDALLLRRRHRGIDDGALRSLLTERLSELPARIHLGSERLLAADARPVADLDVEIRRVLDDAGLPQRYLPAITTAYQREPRPTAFGVSQAITLAAQGLTPEERLELEEAAGNYLAMN
jgi:hypothetical protein